MFDALFAEEDAFDPDDELPMFGQDVVPEPNVNLNADRTSMTAQELKLLRAAVIGVQPLVLGGVWWFFRRRRSRNVRERRDKSSYGEATGTDIALVNASTVGSSSGTVASDSGTSGFIEMMVTSSTGSLSTGSKALSSISSASSTDYQVMRSVSKLDQMRGAKLKTMLNELEYYHLPQTALVLTRNILCLAMVYCSRLNNGQMRNTGRVLPTRDVVRVFLNSQWGDFRIEARDRSSSVDCGSADWFLCNSVL